MAAQTFILPVVKDTSASFTVRDGPTGRLLALLNALDPSKPWLVSVERFVKKRTNLQNAALWGCAYKALKESTGNDPEDLHEYFCGEYWGWDVFDVMGRKKKKPKRTTTTGYDGKSDVISTVDLSAFYDFIQQRSAQNGYDVPAPNPMWWQAKAA